MHDVPGRPSAPSQGQAGTGDVSRPDLRAGVRLGLALLGAALLAVVLGPVALLVDGEWAPLVDLDSETTQAAEAAVRDSPALLAAARLLTHLGDPVLVTVVTVAAVVALLQRGRRRAAVFLTVARVGSLVLSQGTKAVVDRARPAFDDPVSTALGASFPSGHALGGTTFWLTTALVVLPLAPRRRRRLLLVGAVLVSLVVCATRVLLGVHYLSDVTAGFVVAVAWTAVCASVFALWRSEEGRPVHVLDDGLDPEAAGAQGERR